MVSSSNYKSVKEMSDEEVVQMVNEGKLAPYLLEKSLEDTERAVRIRRIILGTICCTILKISSTFKRFLYYYPRFVYKKKKKKTLPFTLTLFPFTFATCSNLPSITV